MDDHELLREYVERQSEAAFAELVARHVNLVYGTARRVVGDPAAAQDVVQGVFIHLARKAWTVRDGRALPGWLYRAAYRTALDAIRGEQRRRQRETEAMKLAEINSADEAAWEKLAPLLDEAMQHLNRAEQDAVVFRFFEGKTMRETGAALGTTEAAAQMRVNRALEKMRAHFARGGVTVAAGALALVLSARPSEAAPTGLAARVTGPSLAGGGGTGVGLVLARILFMSTKTKVLAAVVLVALAIAIFVLNFSRLPSTALLPNSSGNSVSLKTESNSLLDKSQAVALPVVAAVPAKTGTNDAANDLQSDLKTAIPELVRQIRTGIGLYNFSPPNYLARFGMGPAEIQQKQAEIQLERTDVAQSETLEVRQMLQQGTETTAENYETLERQTPIFNAKGDEATYKWVAADGSWQRPLTFIKINGKWYIKPDDMIPEDAL